MGPTGPTGAIEPHGCKYNTSRDNISLETNIAQKILLVNNGPINKIITVIQNTLTIVENSFF